jgi:hypothetical protein
LNVTQIEFILGWRSRTGCPARLEQDAFHE